ncbi:MAG: ATP-binding cassette domain-containing protein [Actinomycetota bacterium]|nr:ATP-binding cassette domain-containing protein [Actinomycetota bacterium]
MSEIIRVGCIRHVYPDKTEVLICGLEFVVKEHERVVILGPNGSGKTTLLNHLMGLLKPVEGKVSVFGVEPSRHFEEIRENFGVVFQDIDAQLIAPTVWDDITFSPRNYGYKPQEIERLANEIMNRIGIADLKKKITHYLSGGEKKKVALAGAMISRPKLLILDEPFEGLDPKSKSDIIDLLNEFNKDFGTTVVLTTHDVNVVPQIADHVYVIVHGNIVLSGSPSEVFHQVDFIRSINLEPPFTSELIANLRARGVMIEYTVDFEKLVDDIVKLIKRSA